MSKQNHWSTISERGSLFGLKTLLFFYQYGGRYLAMIALYPVVLYFFISGKTARKASLTYLERLFLCGHLSEKPTLLLSFKHFLSMSFSALEKVDVWLGNITLDSIEHINLHLFQPLMDEKRGALIIGSHLGNLEICRALSNNNPDVKFNVLVFTEHAQKFNQLLNSINENVAVNLIEVTELGPDLAILLKDKIDQGEYVVIAGDRTSTTVEGRVIYSNFLGQQAPFSQGPFILAGLMQCPVFMMFCIKNQKKYHLIFEQLSTCVKWHRKTRQNELTQLVMAYSATLEKYCALYPLQWFNFFDFWQRDNVNREK